MLLVKTILGASKINGIGLFAGEDVKERTLIWRYNPVFDSSFTPQQVDKLPLLLQEFIKTYAALSTISGNYILSNDHARFTNHSSSPNVIALKIHGETELITKAARDIKRGEEITVDYRVIDKADAEVGDAEYLK